MEKRFLQNIRPPKIATNKRIQHRYRYVASAQVTGVNVRVGSILQAIGVMNGASSTGNYCLTKNFRLKIVEVWAPGQFTASAQPSAVVVEWIGNAYTSLVEKSDISVNSAFPAHVCTSPPPKSDASFWQNDVTLSTVLFQLTCPQGSVLDILVEYIENDSQLAGLAFSSTATGVAGTIYYPYLDRYTNTTPILLPVGLATIT
jgi:hypothetical protein